MAEVEKDDLLGEIAAAYDGLEEGDAGTTPSQSTHTKPDTAETPEEKSTR